MHNIYLLQRCSVAVLKRPAIKQETHNVTGLTASTPSCPAPTHF